MCGGTQFGDGRMAKVGGLSPRVRGNRCRSYPVSRPARSIPACAGEPQPRSPRPAACIYPRVCGGTTAGLSGMGNAAGLSPRVRGNPDDHIANTYAARSIPACAGEPIPAGEWLALPAVYPRVCGGTPSGHNPSQFIIGLSPRVRGNPNPPAGRVMQLRSIPACAGEPVERPAFGAHGGVYPRVCGGTSAPMTTSTSVAGLSPRVRGNLPGGAQPYITHGSIPACAGEPRVRAPGLPAGAVYPRVCGGTRKTPAASIAPAGLSPRVRGNPGGAAAPYRRAGSIPACAGEPPFPFPLRVGAAVYPRVCGGTSPTPQCIALYPGLSPRVRGNQPGVLRRQRHQGSIPACAGEPLPRPGTKWTS